MNNEKRLQALLNEEAAEQALEKETRLAKLRKRMGTIQKTPVPNRAGALEPVFNNPPLRSIQKSAAPTKNTKNTKNTKEGIRFSPSVVKTSNSPHRPVTYYGPTGPYANVAPETLWTTPAEKSATSIDPENRPRIPEFSKIYKYRKSILNEVRKGGNVARGVSLAAAPAATAAPAAPAATAAPPAPAAPAAGNRRKTRHRKARGCSRTRRN
jgi:hypothetical protein